MKYKRKKGKIVKVEEVLNVLSYYLSLKSELSLLFVFISSALDKGENNDIKSP